jgi:SAM-dependent methyltransferase
MAASGHAVTAVDVVDRTTEIAIRNRALLENGRPVASIEFLCRDVRSWTELPRQGPFALVHARRLLHFLRDDELGHLFERLYRATAPGGLLVASFAASGLARRGNAEHVPERLPAVQVHEAMFMHHMGSVCDALVQQRFEVLEQFSDGAAEGAFVAERTH